jgi:rfaE bifunctional protein kinase chain/domain
MPTRYTRSAFDSALNKLKVLIVGDVMIDSYLWGVVERISPEAPVPVLTVKNREKRLGGAGNVIMNVRALGCTPLIASVIGEDEEGRNMLSILHDHQISDAGIVLSASRTTTVKHRILAGTQQLLRVDSETDTPLSQEEQSKLMERIHQLIPACDVVLFQDYDKGVLGESIIAEVVALAEKKGIPTVVDPKKRNFHHYRNTTLFKPNLKEIKEGLQLDSIAITLDALNTAAAELKKRLDVKMALITLSEMGVFVWDGTKGELIPAHKRAIADVSGAGDTVISIAAACLALHTSSYVLAAMSNLGGGIVCEQVGVVPIDKQKLLDEAERTGLLG